MAYQITAQSAGTPFTINRDTPREALEVIRGFRQAKLNGIRILDAKGNAVSEAALTRCVDPWSLRPAEGLIP